MWESVRSTLSKARFPDPVGLGSWASLCPLGFQAIPTIPTRPTPPPPPPTRKRFDNTMSDPKQLHPSQSAQPSHLEDTAFLFDEFFETDEQKTFPLPLKIAGRTVTIQVKKGLSNADRNAAEMAAIRTEKLPNGGVKMVGVDESKLTNALVASAIVSWPFTTRDGSPVPINSETVARLKGGAETILLAVNKFDEEGEAGLATFQANLQAAATGQAE